ncbi:MULTISPECIES: glycerophosphodiester phosphodiesterase family protein [unclassified Microbacterium]|uniref:glycerophosphodiester phosphodiesterase family protein n=1 Tax=unclassified Microbacterium TaxID=2609290 RepID=UPI000EAA3FFF|nr:MULTISPECIES: glycerophosphodiester phosphodiesterase family protein [unclassified Microbacterium]MBT2485888.1 glycerophosphodiester phosphodiesterase [Microbacterium sp. ISL-108]RKN68642.1 glycerophosphodiester phosphodiesterase [Microbacterium sp. CGR2]
MTHPYFSKARYPRILAHRGLITAAGENSGVWENSAASFAAAHAAGIQYIETDCQVTADGDVVLFHDATVERLLGDPRPVHEVRTRELRAVFADHGGLLTVAEALASFPDVRFNIDVKSDAGTGLLGPILVDDAHRVLLTSFSDARRLAAVAAVLRAGASLRPAMSGGRRTIAAVRALSSLRLSPARVLRDIDALQIPERYGAPKVLTPALVRAAHRHGTEVHVWTINDPASMLRLIGAGVDGIVTDRADAAIAALRPGDPSDTPRRPL